MTLSNFTVWSKGNEILSSIALHYYTKTFLNSSQDIRVTSINNSEDTDAEELSTSSTQLVVAALKVVDSNLGKHGIVLELRLS